MKYEFFVTSDVTRFDLIQPGIVITNNNSTLHKFDRLDPDPVAFCEHCRLRLVRYVHGLKFEQLQQAIASSNANSPTGHLVLGTNTR